MIRVFSRNDEFLAHIVSDGLPEAVLPGMTADVVIEVGTRPNALLVPLIAVNNGVLIVERSGRRLKLPVEVGGVDGQMAEITQGDLREDDRIVLPRRTPAKPAGSGT